MVALRGRVLKVIEQAAAQGHELEKTAAGREVFLVTAEVLREVVDALAEPRDLIIRTAGVARVQLVLSRIYGVLCHNRWVNSAAAVLNDPPLLDLPWDKCAEISILPGIRNWIFPGGAPSLPARNEFVSDLSGRIVTGLQPSKSIGYENPGAMPRAVISRAFGAF